MKKRSFNKTLLIVILLIGIMSIVLISSYTLFYKTNLGTEIMQSAGGQNKIETSPTAQPRVIGNPIDIELKNGMNVEFIENSKEKISIRFTAKLSGEATSLAINALASGGQHRIRVGIQEDNNGTPKGEWINEYGFGISQVGGDEGFITVNLQRGVPISKGKVYHIVIEPAENVTSDKIPILTYMTNGFAQPFNNDNQDIVWNDTKMNVLFYDGNGWREENKWPIFVIGYSDNRSEGQPYSLAAPWVIHDQVYVGQEFLPSSDYRIGKIAFVVSLKAEPKDKLYYEIRDSNNTVMAKGLFAEKSNLTIWQTWIEATLHSPVTLKKGEIYKIALLSPRTDLDNAYNVYGDEFTYNASIGYGALQNHLSISYDAGSTWSAWEDADTIFKLTAASRG
jgi:hypothetical protein